MKKEKQKCLYVKQLKSFGIESILVGVFVVLAGLFVFFCPDHLLYNQIFSLIIFIVLGIAAIIKGVWYFVRIYKICK